jgi:hypothetical protein
MSDKSIGGNRVLAYVVIMRRPPGLDLPGLASPKRAGRAFLFPNLAHTKRTVASSYFKFLNSGSPASA